MFAPARFPSVCGMKAIRQARYGGPEVLELVEVPDPVPGPGEILVRVHAAALNAADWHVMRGDPWLARLATPGIFGRSGPLHPVRGHDVAGTVVATGSGSSRFLVGDAVVADVDDKAGTFAELVVAPEALFVAKPEALSFEEAAALPLAGTTALCLLDAAGVGEETSLLVVGASGGVGTFAVQLAAARGAAVSALCSARNLEQARALGATTVFDRAAGLPGRSFDAVIDLAGKYRLRELLRCTESDGVLVLSGGGTSDGGSVVGPMGLMIAGKLAGLRGRPVVKIPAVTGGQGLAELVALAAEGTVKPVIERRFALAEVPEAIRYMEQEHARGKLIVLP
jgi:NADPH:quinone reductase-like Zn-dependent oxidoreductase